MKAGKERLARDAVRGATQQEVQQLKLENGGIKRLVADLPPGVYRLEKAAISMPHDVRTTEDLRTM